MNFTAAYDYLVNGEEWRGVRTKDHSYAKWLNGQIELFDLRRDPLQMNNLSTNPEFGILEKEMEGQLKELMDRRNDTLIPCTDYGNWFDEQRRVVRNVYGTLRDPEVHPDWSLLS